MSRSAATAVIRKLHEHGHAAYLAGGCVRDRLLGLTPKDHDVATDARPAEVRKLFPRSQAVGEAFGVILVYQRTAPQDQTDAGRRVPVEVATFRAEAGYADHRRPDAVTFTDAPHDAQRRDFTVNGLFESPGELPPAAELKPARDPSTAPPSNVQPTTRRLTDGSIILDFVGGLADLKAKTLRAIGDPDERFGEDYLRMLRAVRFAARLGFTLDPVTAQAIRNLAKHLGQISRERIGGEVLAMLAHPRRADALNLLQSLRLDGPTLGEDNLQASLPTVAALPEEAPAVTTLAAWLLDRRVPDAASNPPVDHPAGPQGRDQTFPSASAGQTYRDLLSRLPRYRKALCLSNDHTDTLTRIFRHLDAAGRWPSMTIAQRKRLLTAPDWEHACALLRARSEAQDIEQDAARLAADGIGLAPDPLLTGRDLIGLGLKPGPRFKTLLDEAYDRQLEGQLTTRPEALKWVQTRS